MTQREQLRRLNAKIHDAIDSTYVAVPSGSSHRTPSEVRSASHLMGRLVKAGDILRGGPDIAGLAQNARDLRDLSGELHRNASHALMDAVTTASTTGGKPDTRQVAQYLEQINTAMTVLRYGSVAAAPKPWLNKIGGLLLGILVGGGGAYYFGSTDGESTSPDTNVQPAALNTRSSPTGGASVQPADTKGPALPGSP